MEVIISIVSELVQYTVSPVLCHLGYLFRYKKNIDNLRNEIQHLKYVKDKLQHAVDDATMKGDEIEVEVQTWLTEVCGICEETGKYLEHEGQANTKCSSIGSFPNLVLRHRISRKAKKLKEAIVSEIQNGNKFDKVSYRPLLERIVDVKGFEAFETRNPILREIMEALKDPDVSMVGLFGMGGVGKTMLAKEVARRTKEENVFTHVVVATVSQTPNYEKFQQEIGDRLGLEFTEKSLSARADRLQYRLRQEKKMLIIVDDVWEKLDLHDFGISFGDDQKGCKILLTSRFQDVLSNDMGVEKNFKIELLSEDEAWSLFGKIVGDFVKTFDIQPLATQIVRECACLPIAITTVANALKNKSYPGWKDALQELTTSNPTNIKGMHANVYSTIKLSYDFLGSEEARSLLLLCSLHEEDKNITLNYLVKYGFGLGIFEGITKLEEVRNRVLTLFESLKSSCLLLEGDYANTVKMHDVVRDAITSIGSKERQMYNIGSVAEINECLKKKKLKESYAISLLSTNADKLPKQMECPLLEFFCINSINQSLEIPDHFFQETKELRVLDLTFLCFEPLPSSLCFLQNLQTLCLFQCKLGDISLLGELKNLEILDLSWTNIKQLPEQIGQLTHLRLLDLRCCYDLEVIQPNIISKLQRLEDLNMEASFTKWEFEGVNAEKSNANIRELKHLSRLTTLNMHIPHVNIVPEDLFSEKLERFKILVGDVRWCDNCGRSDPRTMLKLKLNKSCLLDKHGLKLLLGRSEELYLDGIEVVNNVVYELHKEGFPQLKHLEFKNNTGIRHILQPMEETVLCSAFPSLESLYLNKLIVLENIFHGKLTAGSFGKLKSITVIKCDRLKSTFPFSIVKQLEEIEVSECKIMREIVTCGKENEAHSANNVADDVIVFPQLHSLILQSLPNLIQFFQSDSREGHLFAIASMPLFNGKIQFPNLAVLELFSLNFTNIWSDQFPDRFYTNKLTRLTVQSCGKLKNLISYSICRSLVHLKNLEVGDCDILKEVIGTQESGDKGRSENICLPKLESLILLNLPNLKRFCSGNCIECPSLLKMRIENCCKLRTFISNSTDIPEEMDLPTKLPLFNDKVILANLEELTVDWSRVMSEIWHCQSPAASFCKLKVLHLSCSRYKPVVLSIENIYRLQNLENLCLSGVLLKEIYCQKGLAAGPAGIPICLSALKLSRLPNLLHLLTEKVEKDKAFQNLRILDVTRCGRLKSLVPSSMSFQHLTALRVSECHALKNLLAFSTVTSLSQLTRLSITDCMGIIEIVENEGGGTNAEIVFGNLKILALHRLPSLRSFYSGNSSMKFPCLEKVVVSQCPEMRSFSCGIIDSRKVNSIVIEIEKEWIWEQENIEWYFEYMEYDKPIQQLWEGDINATVHKLWEDHHPVTALQRLFTEANVQNYEEKACSSSFECRI